MTTFKLLLMTFIGIIAADKYTKLYNLVCDTSPKWAENVTCDLKVMGRNVVFANMEMDVKRPLNNISVHFQIFKFYNQFRPFIVDVSFSVCDVLSKKSESNFYINSMLRILSKFSNAVKCPLNGHLYARNLEIKYQYFKVFMEEGKYRLNFYFFEGYRLNSVGNATIYVEIFQKYIRPTKKNNSDNKSVVAI
ncbi:hypothetical protein ACFFRR_006540 [Megaselia abdita]